MSYIGWQHEKMLLESLKISLKNGTASSVPISRPNFYLLTDKSLAFKAKNWKSVEKWCQRRVWRDEKTTRYRFRFLRQKGNGKKRKMKIKSFLNSK